MGGRFGLRAAAGLAAALALLAGGIGGTPAVAATAPIGSFPTWTKAAPGQFDGVFSTASGFPTAHLVTDDTGAGVAAGKSAFLGASTGFGQAFGSSRLQPYITIGALMFSTATATITFDSPPPVGWGFALGDIDADYVSITAEAAGSPVSSSQLGVQDPAGPVLNYCKNASPKPTGCASSDAPYDDVPTWCPAGAADPDCSGVPVDSLVGSGGDTSGAYGWFVPTVAVDELTLVFTPVIGVPSFQFWIVAPAPAATVSGLVQFDLAAGDPIPAGVQVALLDAAGDPVKDIEDEPLTVAVPGDGAFSFVTEYGDYRLDLIVPADVVIEDPTQFPVPFSAAADTQDLGTLALAAPPAVGPPAAVDPGPQLSATGVDAAPWLAGAAGLLALGLVLFSLRGKARARR